MPLEFSFLEKLYIIAALLTAIESYVLSGIVVGTNSKAPVNRSYGLMGLLIGTWSLLLFFCHIVESPDLALLLNRTLHAVSVFIAISYYYFTYRLLSLKEPVLLWIGWVCAFFLSVLCFSDKIVLAMAPKNGFHLWPVPGALFNVYLFFFTFFGCYSLLLIFRAFRKSQGAFRVQLFYVFVALAICLIGGSSNFAYALDLAIPPIGNLFIFSYVLILAYAIARYRLMDIRLAAASTGIFIAVYAVTLGGPFYLYKSGYHLVALVVMAILASSGPSIYLFLQRRAHETLLSEQRRYQQTLIQASSGMGRIKDLRKLLKMIVRIVTRAVRIEHSAVYVYSKQANAYLLGSDLCHHHLASFPEVIAVESPLVRELQRQTSPVLVDEVAQRVSPLNLADTAGLVSQMRTINAVMVVPSMVEGRLIGILVLGQKLSRGNFSSDDVSVFTILGNQSALAIENALFYEDMKKTHEQLFKAEKMATIGIMADGLSHQINNRLHAMGFVAGDMLDTLNFKKELFCSPELKSIEEEFRKGFERLEDNVKRGSEIVQGLMKYTRKGDEGFTSCSLEEVLKSSWDMAQFKIKGDQMKVVQDLGADGGVKVRGNFTQLQEVFFNLFDNAYDAMMQRKEELKEEGYIPAVSIKAEIVGSEAIVYFQDNGIGVKDDDREKLFTPFFTTKATSRKGTGLGLYVIRKIIEDNHGGKIEMNSRYREGTGFVLRIPAAGV